MRGLDGRDPGGLEEPTMDDVTGRAVRAGAADAARTGGAGGPAAKAAAEPAGKVAGKPAAGRRKVVGRAGKAVEPASAKPAARAGEAVSAADVEELLRVIASLREQADALRREADELRGETESLRDEADELRGKARERCRELRDLEIDLEIRRGTIELLGKEPGADPDNLSNRERSLLADRVAERTGEPVGSLL
ncbi:hypothetical protein ACLUXB_09115, partial [Pseudoscardovia radai]